jgi:hypothetical protein
MSSLSPRNDPSLSTLYLTSLGAVVAVGLITRDAAITGAVAGMWTATCAAIGVLSKARRD